MSSDHRVIVESTPQQAQPAAESRRGSLLGWTLSIILVLVLVVRFLPEALMLWGLWTPPALVEATAQPVVTVGPAVTVRAIPVGQPAAPVQPTAPTSPPAVQVDPAAPLPAPAPAEYVPPAQPIVQPTADPTYAHTIGEYSDRDACSMPRANPQTCGQFDEGDVPELPWPNGRP